MLPDSAMRRRGVFYTPLPFAQKALDAINQTLPVSWLQSGHYRLWDMAAGTGHLEHFLSKESQKYCYLSTLEQKDVEHLRQAFPDATVFQYNYLDDDTKKMPMPLQNDLADPAIKWVVLVNPPYATAQEAGLKGRSKEGVAETKIRKRMHAEKLGEVSRELYVQFLYRILLEFKHRKTILGLFAPLKYLVSTNYQKFRDHVFSAVFQSGFLFSSENFGGTSRTSHFPVSFILWDIHQKKSAAEQVIQLDILDQTAQKIGTKIVKPVNRTDFLSRWIQRPRGTKIFPPFGSALTLKTKNADVRNRIADGFLASLMCPGNELQNQQQTAFLSGPQASAGAVSVTPDNFEQAVTVFAARRIPQDSWITHVDQLLRPNRELSLAFISDCAVWSLFDSKNQTVSLRNVRYQDRIYQIVNHFFPFPPSVMQHWNIRDQAILSSLSEADGSFVAQWLERQTLSCEAREVMVCAEALYQFFYACWPELRKAEFGIETFDAGWYQIRKSLENSAVGKKWLADLKHRHDRLKQTLLPQLQDYGMVS